MYPYEDEPRGAGGDKDATNERALADAQSTTRKKVVESKLYTYFILIIFQNIRPCLFFAVLDFQHHPTALGVWYSVRSSMYSFIHPSAHSFVRSFIRSLLQNDDDVDKDGCSTPAIIIVVIVVVVVVVVNIIISSIRSCSSKFSFPN